MFFSSSTGGFYSSELHGSDMPADVVEITDEEYETLFLGQSLGRVIRPGPDGAPMLVDADALAPEELLALERARMVVSRFQARAALHLAGLLPQVEAAVAAADPLVRIAWADAQEFRRASPTIAALAAALELDDETLDQLFRDAAQIVA